MTRTATLVAIALISALATPVVVNATTPKTPVVAGAGLTAPAATAEPTCVRRIKVVYAGYDEGQATPCTVLVR